MTLYREYRPQSFADFVNQKPIKETIAQEILQDKVAHAYLFTGPRGVGKTTMARLLAKALNCERRLPTAFEPCNKCLSCLEITKGVALDLEEKDAASNRGIDEIRSLRDRVRFAPTRSRYKIIIIDEAHMLTMPAFNALLKTLEEPPPATIFILATTEPFKLPETIISRCQRFDFKKISESEIITFLRKIAGAEKLRIEETILQNIAWRSEGCLRDALGLLGQITALATAENDRVITWREAQLVMPRSDEQTLGRVCGALANHQTAAAIGEVNSLLEDGRDLEQFTLDLIKFIHLKLLDTINTDAESTLVNDYRLMLDILSKHFNRLKDMAYLPQLPLELAILEIIDRISAPEKTKTPDITPVTPSASVTPITPVSGDRLTAIKSLWPAVLNKIRGHNHSLPVALSSCTPIKLEGDKLTLSFKYRLHYQVINQEKNRATIEQVLTEMIGEQMIIVGEISENFVPLTVADPESDLKATAEAVDEVFET